MTTLLIRSIAGASALGLFATVSFAQDVTGAGASFPAPLYAKWADAYNKATGLRLNYQSVGSGAGMNQIRAKTVDFGASDAPAAVEAYAVDELAADFTARRIRAAVAGRSPYTESGR